MNEAPRSLNGWKAIAAYCKRDERTVMRWAGDRGMPVHRVPGSPRAPVYALPDELAAWLADGQQRAEPVGGLPAPVSLPQPRRSLLVGTLVGGLLACGAVASFFAADKFGGDSVQAARAPRDSAAEAAYLQGRYELSTRTAPGLQRAAAHFERATTIDPAFAAAHAALGETWLMLREYGDLPDAEAYARAKSAAQTAVALDPGNAAAHRVLGFTAFWWDGDVTTARQNFNEALHLAPRDAETHHWLATALSANGEDAAALNEILAAWRLDPKSSPILADYGYILMRAGQPKQGQALIRGVQVSAPRQASPYHYLAEFALAAGDGATYLDQAAICAQLRGDAAATAQVAAARVGFAKGGYNGLIDALVAAQPDSPSLARTYTLAQLAALRGDAPQSLAMLASLRGEKRTLAFVAGDVAFQSLRGDARFAPYLQRPSLMP